jgi:hypothetical protein
MQKISVYPPPSTPLKQPPKGRKTDHHITRVRRGSVADQQLFGPPKYLDRGKTIAIGHAIEL